MSMGFGWLGRNEIVANRTKSSCSNCEVSDTKQKIDNRPAIVKIVEEYRRKQ